MSNEKLSYKGYEGSVEVSPDGRFTGKVLDIRCGLIYEGLTLMELQDAFQSVIDAYLDYCSSESIRAEKPSSFPDVLNTKLCKPYDAVDFLESKEDYALYLQSCFEEDPGDGSLIKSAILDIAKAKGMVEVARESGLTREGLYKALGPAGNPKFGTVTKILSALGIELRPIVAPQIKTA